jgi:hypothetical protein
VHVAATWDWIPALTVSAVLIEGLPSVAWMLVGVNDKPARQTSPKETLVTVAPLIPNELLRVAPLAVSLILV